MCFRMQFLCKKWPIQSAFLLVTVYEIFLSSLTLCNTSFFTRSVQMIFSILLQHRISKLSKHFWCTVSSVQVSGPYKTVLQLQNFTSFSHNFKSNLLVKSLLAWIRDSKVGLREQERKSSTFSFLSFLWRSEHDIFLAYFSNCPRFW